MTDEDVTGLEALFESARQSRDINGEMVVSDPDKALFVVRHQGDEAVDIIDLEKFLAEPRRLKGFITVRTPASDDCRRLP